MGNSQVDKNNIILQNSCIFLGYQVCRWVINLKKMCIFWILVLIVNLRNMYFSDILWVDRRLTYSILWMKFILFWKTISQIWESLHSKATFSSSSHVLNLSLGLFFKLPSLFSSVSIFSQAQNGITLTFLLSNNCRSPSLPGFGKLGADNTPFSRSSDMLTTCNPIKQLKQLVITTYKPWKIMLLLAVAG